MRTTAKFVAALVVLAGAACSPSQRSSPSGADLDRAEALRGELAGSQATASSATVADFEVPPAPRIENKRLGSSEGHAAARKTVAKAPELQTLVAPSFSVVAPVIANVTQPDLAALPTPFIPVMYAAPSMSLGGDDTGPVQHSDGGAVADGRSSTGKGAARPAAGGIILRGGPATEGIDPCAKHIQVKAPRGSAMVNNKLPTTGAGAGLPR